MTKPNNTASGAADFTDVQYLEQMANHYASSPVPEIRAHQKRLRAIAAALESAAPQPNTACAALPDTYYLAGGEVKTWDENQMRAFADATHTLRASRGQAPAGADLAFMLKTARLLAELHGESVLSEQQCAKHMGIDLVSWRRLEDCFSGGVFMPEGGGAELPREDSESVLREALGLAPAPAPSVLEDAARYRHIRDVPHSEEVRSVLIHQQNAVMDRVIDKDRAAMAAKKGDAHE